ncbi:type II secretion system protein N [Pollutimonas bauzanensis]|uniref:Type II secretion system protein N n=1 Tax=Pollutimonas bauzanensis TaxID=658167 RepID=A0A1M5NVK6_9BURK|nr:type II secretion system protein N [Pollutimonas bauzanensis]SHG93219.1 type II secretion system protein N (GspN) [Pollutimonas bauzanensis]
MTRLALGAAGLLLLACAGALAVMPARWLMAALPAAWPLAVVDAAGTIWSGSATIALGAPGRRRTLAEPLRWRVSLAGGPRVLASHPWLGGALALAPGWRGIKVSAQTLQLPASALIALHPAMSTIGPGGELLLSWPASVIGAGGPPPGAKLVDIQWRNASAALTPLRPMGSYTLAITQGAQDRIDLALSTQQGPLQLQGKGTLTGSGGLQFDGAAQADPAANADIRAALDDLLAALGPRDGNRTLLRFR